ncbi:MAG TPA: hypothetical protein VN372_00155, partial [Methanospirillum sp.]|nr:hypothetical protein [Methanospirillum sp.]
FFVLLFMCSVPVFSTGANTTAESQSSTLITITPSSESVEVGDSFTIEGFIDPSILGNAPGTVTLILNAPMASQNEAYYMLTPDRSGTFVKTIDADVSGTWRISAKYGDESSAVSEVKITPRETTKKTTNTLNSYGGPADVRTDLEMSGYVRDSTGVGVPNRPVIFQVAIPSYGCTICPDNEDRLIWKTYGTVYTDEVGKYTLSFTPYDTGKYRVKTFFANDEIYRSSRSDTRSVTVR